MCKLFDFYCFYVET